MNPRRKQFHDVEFYESTQLHNRYFLDKNEADFKDEFTELDEDMEFFDFDYLDLDDDELGIRMESRYLDDPDWFGKNI